jgi:hypothetical protein
MARYRSVLGMLDDPMEEFSPLRQFSLPRVQPVDALRPMAPAQAEVEKESLLGRGLSGLEYLGSVLDKPFRAARGLLAGNMREGLAAIPFSDSVGLTDYSQNVTTDKLLQKAGLVGANDSRKWELRDFIVPAVDIAADPLNFLSFGSKTALTGLGKAVSKVDDLSNISRVNMLKGFIDTEPAMLARGLSAGKVQHMMDKGKMIASADLVQKLQNMGQKVETGKPLSGMIGVGLPFSDPLITFGSGKYAQTVAGWTDKAADFMKFGNPISRQWNALFDADVRGTTDELSQRTAKTASKELRNLQRENRYHDYKIRSEFEKAAGTPDELTALNLVRQNVESVFPTEEFSLNDPNLAAMASSVAGKIGKRYDDFYERGRQVGSPTMHLNDKYTTYGSRTALSDSKKAAGMSQDRFSTSSRANRHRNDWLRDIPGGTVLINKWSTDPALAGKSRTLPLTDAADRILTDMLQAASDAGHVVDPTDMATMEAKALRIARKFGKRDDEKVKAGMTMFAPDVLDDLTRRSEQFARSASNAKGVIKGLAHAAQPIGPDLIPLNSVLNQLGLRHAHSDDVKLKPHAGAGVELLRALAPKGAKSTEKLVTKKSIRPIERALSKFGIKEEDLANLTKSYEGWSTPEEVASALPVIDSFTNLFKGLNYTIFLPSHIRNLMSGVTSNLPVTGLSPEYTKGMSDQFKVMRNIDPGSFPGSAGLTGADLIDDIKARQFASMKSFTGLNQMSEIVGKDQLSRLANNQTTGSRITAPLPGSDIVGKGGFLGDTLRLLGSGIKESVVGNPKIPGSRNPLHMSGVFGHTEDAWAPIRVGHRFGSNIEDFIRGSGWNSLVRQGYGDAQAAEKVFGAHFDYGNLSSFERKFMKRVFPFYTFMSRNLPYQAKLLATRPSAVNPMVRAARYFARPDENTYIPEYLASGVAIPLGEEKDGVQRYLSELGLPFEEAAQRFRFNAGVPDWKSTADAFIGGMNPLIKGLYEQKEGRQLHTGRPLNDLRPNWIGQLAMQAGGGPGLAQVLSQISMNMPTSRLTSTVDKAIDPRKEAWAKAINLMTGMRISDVDVQKQRYVEAKSELNELLEQAPFVETYSKYFVKPENRAKLDESSRRAYELYLRMLQDSQAFMKRAAQRQGQGE